MEIVSKTVPLSARVQKGLALIKESRYQLIGKNYGLEYLAPPPEKRTMAFIEIFSRLDIKAELAR